MTTSGSAGRPLRIAFADIANTAWTAGSVYYKNLFGAIRELPDGDRPEIIILAGSDNEGGYDVYRKLADRVIEIPPGREGALARDLQRVARRIGIDRSAKKKATQAVLDDAGADALFVSWGDFRGAFETPTLGWIHDFQHVHYPEFFPPYDLDQRDRIFMDIATNCPLVVLSSEDARKDYSKFAPALAHKARVMQFVANPPANVYDLDAASVGTEYHLPDRFLYLPNQFWIHKGHRLVIEALALLKSTRPDIVVACTGNPADARDPLHFGQLLVEVSRQGLRDTFIILGWVPHEDTFRLIRQSVAVLQPSLFEGWSTTVEETKSIGKAIVLSDIPIHREQAPARALFFDPTDPAALAARMVEAYDTLAPGPDAQLEAEARESQPIRMRAYAENFVSIAREAIDLRVS